MKKAPPRLELLRREKCPALVSKSSALPLSHDAWTFGRGETSKYIVKVRSSSIVMLLKL